MVLDSERLRGIEHMLVAPAKLGSLSCSGRAKGSRFQPQRCRTIGGVALLKEHRDLFLAANATRRAFCLGWQSYGQEARRCVRVAICGEAGRGER
jgi:hypothetical protein